MAKVLYISLNGMTEALGESQVVEYLLALVKNNSIHLFSFEKPTSQEKYQRMEKKLKDAGIQWKYFRYSNRFGVFSTLVQIFIAFFAIARCVKKHHIKIIHARSLIPAVIAVSLKFFFKVKVLFDIRGFAIDEKILDGRLKEKAFLTRCLKKLEAYVYKSADHIVTLTDASKPIIEEKYGVPGKNITVIPTCANEEIFKPVTLLQKQKLKESLGFSKEDIVILHNGSLNSSYDFEAELKLFQALSKMDEAIKILFLNNGQHAEILSYLEKYRLPKDHYKVFSAEFQEVPRYLNAADLCVFFVKPSFAKQASAPTKFAEMVACHLYCLTNTGYGDMEYYFNKYSVGFLLDLKEIHSNSKATALKILERMRNYNDIMVNGGDFDRLFHEHFSKEIAINKYQDSYLMMKIKDENPTLN